MAEIAYKKMAGTSAVFLSSDYDHASPVERDGPVWTAQELHLGDLPAPGRTMHSLANALALEGLEDYDPPENGDVRNIESVNSSFIYFKKIQGWVQIY